MKIFTKEQLIADLRKIKSLGPIKNTRGKNNGASGNVLEDLLGIEENNLPLANAAEWEIKSKKKHSNSLITLFHQEPSPTSLKFVSQIFLPHYGWLHQQAGSKYPENEKSFRQTIRCGVFSDRGFTVVVNQAEQKIEVVFDKSRITHADINWKNQVFTAPELPIEPYWGFDDIYHKLGAKLHNCFYAVVEVSKQDNEEYFSYNHIYMLKGLSKEKFIAAIADGLVYIDFDARSGHNHGTKFRIREKSIFSLYDVIEEI